MERNNLFPRHSRAGGNPVDKKSSAQRDDIAVLPASRDACLDWIPACAGMTQWFANGRSGMKRKLGFTMIEMTIVLIMIGILTASLAPLMLRQHTNTMEERDRVALEDAKTAIINYAATFGGIPDPTAASAMPAVSAIGVNNWGAFGNSTTNLFLLDVNDKLKSSCINAATPLTCTTPGLSSGGNRIVFCQVVNAAMSSVSAGTSLPPSICQEFTNNHTSAAPCSAYSPVAFVLYSTGNDRTANQQNGLSGRIYENDKRGINNSTEGTSHYDDQVMSYPLAAFARDCRERMGVLPEVMNCPVGNKYVGSITNNYASSLSFSIGPGAASSVVPGNGFSLYVNTCYAPTDMLAISGVVATSQVSALDANNDGRVDIFISAASAVTAQ